MTKRQNISLRRGLTLVEVSVSTLLVSLLIIGSLNAVSMSTRLAQSSMQRAAGTALAEGLLEEVLDQAYVDSTNPGFGPETGETSNDRSLFDDVDDYDAWTESPPVDLAGTVLAPDDWERSITVNHVDANDPNNAQEDRTDTGVKRITASVTFRGEIMATLTALRTRSAISIVPASETHNATERNAVSNLPPIAVAQADATYGVEQVTVFFDATGSLDPDGDSLSFAWDFSDGNSATGLLASHTFSNTGTFVRSFPVTLAVSDSAGATDTTTILITVEPSAEMQKKTNLTGPPEGPPT